MSAAASTSLRVEYRPIEQLTPYQDNPRTHRDAQIAQTPASIVEFGWTNPVLVDADNELIAGHGRLSEGYVDVAVEPWQAEKGREMVLAG